MVPEVLVIFVVLNHVLAGDLEPRLLNGKQVAFERFPFMVALLENDQLVCGGIAINSSWVLTAGHCIKSYFADYYVRVGTAHLFYGGTKHKISSTFTHPSESIHKIALLKIEEEIVSGGVKEASFGEAHDDQVCSVVGWGVRDEWDPPEEMTFLKVRILPENKCEKLDADTICTSILDKKSICDGDSGGALVCDNKVAGVLSHPHVNKDECGKGGVVMKIDNVWIENTIEGKVESSDSFIRKILYFPKLLFTTIKEFIEDIIKKIAQMILFS